FGDKVRDTLTRVYGPNEGSIMLRLKDKADMSAILKDLEATFTDTPRVKYNVSSWNPSEMPIPDPPQLKVAIRGGTLEERAAAAEQLAQLFEEKQVLPRIWGDPDASHAEEITLTPLLALWPNLRAAGAQFLPSDLADLSRVATIGRRVMDMP